MMDADVTRARFAATADRLARLAAGRIRATRARLTDLLPLTGAETALDAACGTGTLALALAPLVREVIAVDLVPEMLEHGRRAAAAGDSISWLVGDVYDLPVADGAVDVAGIVRSLHHVERPSDAVAELVRVTVPGGRLLVVDQLASDRESEASLFEQIERLRDPSHARTLSDSDVRALVASAGLIVERFAVVRERRSLDGFLDLAGCDDRARERIRDLAADAVDAGRSAGVDLRVGPDGIEFTERVGWYVARVPA